MLIRGSETYSIEYVLNPSEYEMLRFDHYLHFVFPACRSVHSSLLVLYRHRSLQDGNLALVILCFLGCCFIGSATVAVDDEVTCKPYFMLSTLSANFRRAQQRSLEDIQKFV